MIEFIADPFGSEVVPDSHRQFLYDKNGQDQKELKRLSRENRFEVFDDGYCKSFPKTWTKGKAHFDHLDVFSKIIEER